MSCWLPGKRKTHVDTRPAHHLTYLDPKFWDDTKNLDDARLAEDEQEVRRYFLATEITEVTQEEERNDGRGTKGETENC